MPIIFSIKGIRTMGHKYLFSLVAASIMIGSFGLVGCGGNATPTIAAYDKRYE